MSARPLPAVPIAGLTPDSLGSYLASLGIFRVTFRRWPSIRAAWREGVFTLVGGPEDLDALIEHLLDIITSTPFT